MNKNSVKCSVQLCQRFDNRRLVVVLLRRCSSGVHDDQSHGSIRLYRTDNLDEIHQLLPGHNSLCTHVEFSRDGRYMATGDGDGDIILWNWPQRRILKKLPSRNPDKPIIDAVQFADRAPYLMSLEHDGSHIYRVPDGTKMSANDYIPPKILGWMFDVLTENVTWPFAMSRSPRTFEMWLDRNTWAAAGVGRQNGKSRPWIELWNARLMKQHAAATSARVVYRGHRWEVHAIAISPDGSFVAGGDKFGEVHIWDARTGRQRHRIVSQGRSIYEAAFSTTNGQIVFGTRPDLSHWGFNNYGLITNILDLEQRTVRRKPPAPSRHTNS